MKRQLDEIETFRAQELLLQRATDGLDDAEAMELAALGAEDDLSYELAASAIDLATLRIEPMPASIADKILVAAGVAPQRAPIRPPLRLQTIAGVAPPRSISTVPPQQMYEPPTIVSVPVAPVAPPVTAPVIPIEAAKKRTKRSGPNYAVIAAAASIAIGAGAVIWATQQPAKEVVVTKTEIREVPAPISKPPTPTEARAQLLASAKDVSTLAWSATPDPNAKGASGDVVWSASQQKGFMRFVGLTPNDKSQIQYQLWIFDKNRPQETPVDGGVFDVSSTGEVIVPITAKLDVSEPVLFAVTIEKPGGVVVSKRERIVVTAAPKAS